MIETLYKKKLRDSMPDVKICIKANPMITYLESVYHKQVVWILKEYPN